MQIATFFLIALLGIIESWLQPWASVWGISLPLVFIGLVVMQARVNIETLPWLGLTAGMVLDLGGAHYLGSNALYYLIIGWILMVKSPRVFTFSVIWIRIWVVVAAALLQPWYLLLVHRQFESDLLSIAWVGAIRAIIVIIVAFIYMWTFMCKEMERT